MRDNRKNILLADDDLAILEVMGIIMEQAGYKVATTANGAEVSEMCVAEPDLLLLDISMSGTDGRDICKQLKHNEKTKHIPIVMVSANRYTEQIAREAGADGFLMKPFEMNHLLKVIETHIR